MAFLFIGILLRYWEKREGKQENKSQLNSILLSQFLWFQASENYS